MRLSLNARLLPLALAPLLLLFSSSAADAWCIDNLSGGLVTARIWDPAGLYDRTLVVPQDQVCETILFMDETRPLVLRIESDRGFQGQVDFRAGGSALVAVKDRTPLGINVDLLYVESKDTNGVLIGREPWWVHDERKGASRRFQFIATADPQYYLTPPNEMNAETTHVKETSDAVIGTASGLIDEGRRGVIIAGDLTQNSRTAERQALIDAEAGRGRYFYEGLGNHDFDGRINTCLFFYGACPQGLVDLVRDKKRVTTPTARATDGAPHYSWDWDDVHFVQLNLMPSDHGSSNTENKDAVPYDALTFLKQDLADHVGDSGRPVVLIHHYGFDSFSIQDSEDGTPGRWWDQSQRNDYWQALAPYRVAAIIAGHNHQQVDSDSAFLDWTRPSGLHDGPAKIFSIIAGAAKAETVAIASGAMTDIQIEGNWIIAQRRDGQGRDSAGLFWPYPSRAVYFGAPRVTVSPTACVPSADGGCAIDLAVTSVFPRPDYPDVDAGADVSYEWTTTCDEDVVTLDASPVTRPRVLFSDFASCSVTVKVTNARGGLSTSVTTDLAVVPQTPTLTRVPANISVQATSPAGAPVYFDLPRASDPQDGALPVSCSKASGATFPIGATTVTCTATDGDAHTASASFTVTVLDTTTPVVTATVSPRPNEHGWNNTPVTVQWSILEVGAIATKTGCGTVTVATDTSGDVLTCTVVDASGNSGSASVTVKLDQVKPVVTFAAPVSAIPVNANGWYRSAVTIAYTVADDRSTLTAETAVSGTLSFAADGANLKQIVGATDLAGNLTIASSPKVSIDRVAPQIFARVYYTGLGLYTPGWYRSAVTVAFFCSDSHSGIESCTPDQTVSSEGRDQSRTGRAVDRAGNEASVTEGGINIDMTPPVVTGVRLTPPNAHGWNNAPVRVSFNGTDALSGIKDVRGDPLPAPSSSTSQEVTYFVEGVNQSVTIFMTDLAGNVGWGVLEGVNIDVQPPIITPTPDRLPNARGWYNADVTVSYSCVDYTSGVESCSPPETTHEESVLVRLEGRAVDLAGNVGTVLADMQIDKTAPVVTGARLTPANVHGWNRGPVSASFSAVDGLSGLNDVATAVVSIATEGRDQSATFAFVDIAGNRGVGTVPGINIDVTPPTITAHRNQPPNADNWHNADVTVTFDCADAISDILSCSAPSTVSDEGVNRARSGVATDLAGNQAAVTEAGINLDKTPPVVTGQRITAANTYGWNNAPVTSTFSATDALSGVSGAATGQLTLSGEGAGQSASLAFTDRAGNTAAGVVSGINIDRTAPIVTAVRDRAPNGNNWYNANVVVSFSCQDALSDVQSCGAPVTLTAEGANQSAAGAAMDRAGNAASVIEAGINVDKTAPHISGARLTPANANGWNNTDVAVAFTCGDALSGVGGCGPTPQVISEEGMNLSRTATVTDLAGNIASATVAGVNIDKTAPALSCSSNPSFLWPANGKLLAVSNTVSVAGGLSGSLGFVLSGVSSNEPNSGTKGEADIQGFVVGAASTSGQLRADRDPHGTGRLYSFVYEGTDRAGNTSTCSTTVAVPKNQSK